MNKNLIITIFVPTGQENQRDIGDIGTGYPVADDLILTSRHIIDGGSGEIQVRWHYCTDEDAPKKGWITLSPDNIVWKGEGELDAVLLRCSRPEKAQGKGWGAIADKKPPSNESWQSQGFPCATRCKNVRHPDDVSGTTESMADQADHFVLNVNSPPKDTDMWRGSSGMPVFVHGEIFGVVDRVPENFDGNKLYAIPCWKMFKDKNFAKVILASQENWITKDIKNIEELFDDDKNYNPALIKLHLLCVDLLLLCENEKNLLCKDIKICQDKKNCKEFKQRAESLLREYDEFEDSKRNGICKLGSHKLIREGICISSKLLLVDMKKCFNGKIEYIVYEKEALRIKKQYNIMLKRKIKVEGDLTGCDDPCMIKKLDDILKYLKQTIGYLKKSINSFSALIDKLKLVKEYE